MIRDIFIPRVIGSYYIFAQRIIAFDIGKIYIQATLVKAYKKTRTIEKCIREKISDEIDLSYQERASKAILKILGSMGEYDSIVTALPTGFIVFKELTVPFLLPEMIVQVLPYEIEPLLPFGLEYADFDFIVTKSYKEEKKSDILVAAVKKEIVAQHLQLFSLAAIDVEKITIDLFELYALYNSMACYESVPGIIALVDIGFYATRVAVVVEGQLKYIRSLSAGVLSFAQDSSQQLLVFEQEKLQKFMLEIQFTMQPYAENYSKEKARTIIFTGNGAEIQGLVEKITDLCGHACELFNMQKIAQKDRVIVSQSQSLSQGFAVSIATALSFDATQHINLEKILTKGRTEFLLSWQIITACGLSLFLVSILSLSLWTEKKKYSYEIEKSTQEAISLLKADFVKINQLKGKVALSKANTLAEDEVKKEEAILSQLLRKNRISFLACLEELSQRIDREGLGFDVSKLTLNEASKQIFIDGKVRGYKELALLEQSLRRSRMFTFVGPKLQELTFEIKLLINEDYGKE
jgi:Tfp pilus assembly PilM family ATPase